MIFQENTWKIKVYCCIILKHCGEREDSKNNQRRKNVVMRGFDQNSFKHFTSSTRN